MKKPTEAQLDIISFNGNTVVTASPGSGKTFCLVEKIKKSYQDYLTSKDLLQ